MAYGVLDTLSGVMDQPYYPRDPMAPAGITDAQRFGWMNQVQGLQSQLAPTQQFGNNMNQFANMATQGWQSGAFGTNPLMQTSAGLAGQMGNMGYGQPSQMFSNAANQPGFGMSNNWARGAGQQPGFGKSANYAGAGAATGDFGAGQMAQNNMAQYGGGWSGSLANQINQTGASFDPFNNPALSSSISEANKLLGRDFRQQVMPQLNRSAVAAGPGAYGGTRAGVAQGMREQGLMDAMQRQTTDMMARGYESGLNRMVQDRANTLSTTLGAMQQGGQLGLGTAQLMGNLAGQQATNQFNAARQLASNAAAQGQLGLGVANQLAGNAYQQGQLGMAGAQGIAGIKDSMARNLGNAATTIGGLGQYGLGQQNAMFNNLPNFYQQAYGANLLPGQLQQQMGGLFGQIGQAQQGANQNQINWFNNQWNDMQGYPQARAGWYAGTAQPYLQPGNTGTVNPQATGGNAFNDITSGIRTGANVGQTIGDWIGQEKASNIMGGYLGSGGGGGMGGLY